MTHPLRAIHIHAFDFWFARASVLVIVGLQTQLGRHIALGPIWLAPGIELALLIPLSIVTAWAQSRAASATTDEHWRVVMRHRVAVRTLALVLTGVITVINFGSLIKVVDALLHGPAGVNGQRLLIDAVNIWAINIIAFALWYWNLDRGGPAARGLLQRTEPDFLFAQMSAPGPQPGWSPGFIDYLFLAFTNATAFSPTDTLPLTGRAKLMMMGQSTISLLTIALVAARAVNILA